MRIGIDIGGTKIAALALADDGRELAHERVATPKDYREILATCVSLAEKLEGGKGARPLGLCMPGAVDASVGRVRFSPNIHALAGQDFVADMKSRFGREVKIANDAGCFSLSEASDGAAKGLGNVYGVILGTGVGGCQVVEGKIVNGPNAMHEWGHIPLPWAEKTDIPARCGCGREGCVESYLSGPALHRQLHQALGREIGNAELIKAIAQKDETVMRVMDTYSTRLAKALAVLVLVLDPDAIVFGGGLCNLDLLYEEMPKRIPKYTVLPDIQTKVLKAAHGDDSGLRGAAWLWPVK